MWYFPKGKASMFLFHFCRAVICLKLTTRYLVLCCLLYSGGVVNCDVVQPVYKCSFCETYVGFSFAVFCVCHLD